MADDDLTPGARARAGARHGSAGARHREPAAAAGDSAPAQPGIGGVVSGLSARATWPSRRRARTFCGEFGYLTDNPAIGPALAAHYWEPGNSVDHNSMLRSLTGEGFSARHLAEECNDSADEACARAEALDARRGSPPLSRRGAGLARCAHPHRAWRRGARRLQRRRRRRCAIGSRRWVRAHYTAPI